MTSSQDLAAALDGIKDPLSGRGLIEAKRAAAPRLSPDGVASVILDVSGLAPTQRDLLEADVKRVLRAQDGVSNVRVAMTAEKTSRTIVAVGSGKGGVGKSTLTANLAVALVRSGLKVGLVDADIYGPSQPKLMDSEGRRPTAQGQKLLPIQTRFGVPMLSMGHLVPPGQAIAWRGPMTSNALGQLLDAEWGDTQVILVDLPPGTGDVQLSMMAKHKPAGAIIVSTPQDLALIDATRAIDLFRQSSVPIVGLVENMAGYACPHCGELSDPFGSGGAEAAAAAMGYPFLGRIPLDIAIRVASDGSEPPAAGSGPESLPFKAIAEKLKAWLELSPAERVPQADAPQPDHPE